MASKMPRIVISSPVAPPEGGVATWAKEVLASNLRDEFELHLVNTAPKAAVDPLNEQKRFRWDRVFQSAAMGGKMLGKLVTARPRLIHANTSYYWALARDLPFALSGKPLGAKAVLHMHGGNFHHFLDGLSPTARKTTLTALRRVDALISITGETTRSLVDEMGLTNTVFLPNFTDTTRFDPIPQRNPDARPVKGIFVGWMITTKGTYELVEAVKEVEGLTVDMFGHTTSEEERDRLQTAIDDAGVSDRITIAGPVPHEEISSRLLAADLFILPTHKEGFPLSVLEAMAAGLPSVVSRVGAVPDIIRHEEDGLLIPPQDPVALTQALRTLVDNGPLRIAMGESAARRVRTEFDMPVITRQIGDLWRSLITGK